MPSEFSITLKNIDISNLPVRYVPSAGLVQAVEVAYALKRPLLLSGEPGTGKTEFAKWVAYQLQNQGFNAEPLIYNTKSSSNAQDLFYYYDAVSHFRETNIAKGDASASDFKKTTADFIELKALGLAFSKAKGNVSLNTSNATDATGSESKGNVVLIDEIDKAPRDFPNDLLNEIERYEFEIKELNQTIKLRDEEKEKILIIMTSNFEKNLPDPFLRRCVYYHIEFPGASDLKEIIKSRLALTDNELDKVTGRIDDFFKIRETAGIQKKPSTSEFIDWIRVIRDNKLLSENLFKNNYIDKTSRLLNFMPLLLKKKEDIMLFNS